MKRAPPKRHSHILRRLDESLPIVLLRAREAAMASFRPMLRTHDLTEQQWRVIRVLAGRGDLEVSELADATFLLGPSLSRILKNLLGRELLERDSVAEDTRRAVVSLTQAGQELYATIAPEAESIYANIELEFGQQELSNLLQELDKLSSALIKRNS